MVAKLKDVEVADNACYISLKREARSEKLK
jgi:hypothetical protein